jgi:hypothetical protein
MTTLESSDANSAWLDDYFDRKPLSQYLTRGICSHFQEKGRGSLTVALDADWGAGKTFFVRKWIKDLEVERYPVIYFDAWEQDGGDAPAVALMSSILTGLDSWRANAPIQKNIARKVKSHTKEAIRNLRHAILPATAVVAKGLLKKATGIAGDELIEAISGATLSDIETGSEATLGDALDKFFERALEEQKARSSSLAAFRENLHSILQLIADNTDAKFPYFVFIDELDRCRPSYAIKLLEEVKHIFGADGVVYVFSTNIDQLQNSVRGAYGAEFDGRRYLRRLFQREYTLPSPSEDQRIKFALSRLGSRSPEIFVHGLPNEAGGTIEKSWALVAKSMFATDIRAQLQAIELLNEVIGVLRGRSRIHFLYLAYLASLYQTNKEALKKVISRSVPIVDLRTFVASTMREDPELEFVERTSRESERYGARRTEFLSLVIAKYLELERARVKDVYDAGFNDGPLTYPETLASELADDQQSLGGQKNPISEYAGVVDNAGYLTQ